MAQPTCGGLAGPSGERQEEELGWWQKPNPWIHRETNDNNTTKTSDLSSREPYPITMNSNLPRWQNRNRCSGNYPVDTYEWRIPGELLAATAEFHRKVRVDFNVSNLRAIAQAGNNLIQEAGGLDQAQFQFQEHEFRKLTDQYEYVKGQSQWIPTLAEEMMEIMRIGANASYARPPPEPPRRRGLPYRTKDSEEILCKMRNDIKKGRMFVCGANAIGGDAALVEATPSTLVLKRNPDRSWSSEKRVIADLRRINLYFDATENYPVELPTIQELARRIVAMQRKYPQTQISLAKRDIKSAFVLLRLHPQLSKVMATEFPGGLFGLDEDIILFYGVLPFGWGASTGHFCRFSDAIAQLHQLHGPSWPMWNAPYAYRSQMYIDGGLFIELNIGDRKTQTADSRGRIAKATLPSEAINEEKNELEGNWADEKIFLCFTVNTAEMSIRLPEEKRAGATVLFDELFAQFGSRNIRLITMKRIR